MRLRPDLPVVAFATVPGVPAWARPRGAVEREAEAGYFAGAALISLDNLVRSDLVWAGVWRQRLALTCAAAAARLVGRREEQEALRDAHFFRAPGDEPGPAGDLLLAWRRLAGRPTRLDAATLRPVAETLCVRWDDALAAILAEAQGLAASSQPAPLLAAEIAAALYRQRPDAELLAFWLADLLTAQMLRWPTPVPLLMGQAGSGVFKTADGRRRIRPGGEGWRRAVLLAYAQAARDACDLGADLARRAGRLIAVAPKLRAKGAGEVVSLLLNDDAVPSSWSSARLSDRGARRLFERLGKLGAVRELSGRPAFRLYGL
jgi:hypothetical protein